MGGVEGWIIGLSIAVVAIAFVVLVIFLVWTLQELRQNLKQTERLIQDTTQIIEDVEQKIHALDPLFKVVSGVSGAVEKHAYSVKQLTEEVAASRQEEKSQRIHKTANTLLEVIEWGIVGVSLWQKIKERK